MSDVYLKNPVSGDVETVPAEQADALAAERGLRYASPEEIEIHSGQQKYGNQVALGLAETFVRNATLGGVKGLSGTEYEQRERANITEREHPALNFGAQAAPAVAAGLATGGAGLGVAGTLAAEGVLGGLGNVGMANDEAFKHDQELSAEAALGAFGGGFLLGGATAGGAMLAGKAVKGALGATRNRFVEASTSVARKADKAAFEAAGVVRPAEGLSDALEDPVKAAAVRKAGAKARPVAQEKLAESLGELEAAQAKMKEHFSAPVDAEGVHTGEPPAAAGDQFPDDPNRITSKSGRKVGAAGSDSWKGSPKQAASYDRRIAAYGDDPEFQELLQAKAAESRRTPFGPGKERELWELQKDVLEENGKRFPKVAEAPKSPVDLSDKSIEELGANPDPSSFKPETLEALRTGKGGRNDFASEFADSGRVNQKGQIEQGIQIEMGPNGPVLVDGRHRLMVGREKGLTEVYGQVYDGRRTPGKKPVFEGPIPIAKKAPPMASSADTEAVAAQRYAIRDVLDGARKGLEPVATAESKGVVARLFENLDKASTPEDMFSIAQSSRRALDEALDAASDPATAKVLQKYAAQAREVEQSAKLFGAPADTAVSRAAMLRDVEEANAALMKAVGDDDFLATVGTKEGGPVRQAMETYMDRMGEALADMKGADAKAGLKAIAKVRALFDGDLGKVAAENQVNALRQYAGKPIDESSVTNDLLKDLKGEAADALVGMIPGGGAFGVARKLFKYRKHIMRLVGSARGEAEATAGQIVGNAIGAAGKAVAKASPAARALAVRTSALGSRGARFSDIGDDPEKDYERVRGAVELLSKEPDRLADALAAEMGDMPSDAPELVEAVNGKAQRAVDFLASKLPPAFEFALLHPDGPPPSQSDILELSLYWRGATKPREVLEALGNGSAMPEEVEAFRAVNPAWFTELQEALQTKVAQATQTGHVIGAYRIAELETLLDLPGKLDPTFSDSVAAIVQSTAMIKQQKQASYIPAPKAGARTAPKGQA